MLKPLFAATLLVAATPVHAQDRFDIAITVDDLPAHGPLPTGMTRAGIAQSYADTLRARGVPEAWGFVNAIRVIQDPSSEAVLGVWRRAGFPLGNHTYSHVNLGRAASVEAWEADTTAGEALVAKYMPGQDWHYLRFPNLSVGDGDRRDQAVTWLKSKGYREADVSVAFSDWDYTDAYARCLAKGDQATIDAMKAQYLKGVDDGIVRMKAVSQRVYGRIIPQVLLTHIGGFSAVMLPEVMKRLDAAGAHYVTLAQAEADPAYADWGGGSVMDRTAKAKSISLSDIPSPASADNAKNLCR